MSVTHLPPPMSQTDTGNMNIEEKIRQAQKEKLRSIGLRKRSREQTNTTSLRDLSLARKQPVASTYQITNQIESTQSHGDWSSSPNPWNSIAIWNNLQQTEERTVRPNHNFVGIRPPNDVPVKANGPLRESHHPLLTARAKQVAKEETNFMLKQSMMDTLFSQKSRSVTSHDHVQSGSTDTQDLASIEADMDGISVDMAPWRADSSCKAPDRTVQNPDAGETSIRVNGPCASELLTYHGYMCPPPIEWSERDSFNKQDPAFRNTFIRWTEETARIFQDGTKFQPLPRQQVEDLRLHPDGIGLVSPYMTINKTNAKDYGYGDDAEITKYSQAISIHDFEDWGKLDSYRPENKLHKDERTQDYIRNWKVNVKNERAIQEARAQAKLKAKEAKQIYTSDLSPYQPEVNIYIRPALKCDIPQMTWIYNYYVEYSCRTAELDPVPESDMHARLADTQSSNLPFIVACLRNSKSMIRPDRQGRRLDCDATDGETEAETRPVEKVVGWASTNDFTAQHFVERISVELEMYVHPTYRQKGVACCLVDQITQALDRGYIKFGGYPFHCAPEVQRVYEKGGARDIRKVIMIIRKYTHPIDKGECQKAERKGPTPATNGEKLNNCENDYECWMKSWLENCGFRVEGTLSGVGAKKGRL